jgi:hypothetical protein
MVEILDRDEVRGESDGVCLLGANENGTRFLELSVYLKEAYHQGCTVILIYHRQVLQNWYESADDHRREV